MRHGHWPDFSHGGNPGNYDVGSDNRANSSGNLRKINVSLAQHRDHRLGGDLHIFLQMSPVQGFLTRRLFHLQKTPPQRHANSEERRDQAQRRGQRQAAAPGRVIVGADALDGAARPEADTVGSPEYETGLGLRAGAEIERAAITVDVIFCAIVLYALLRLGDTGPRPTHRACRRRKYGLQRRRDSACSWRR